MGKLRKNTKAIILGERFERKGLRGSLQVRFAFEEPTIAPYEIGWAQ